MSSTTEDSDWEATIVTQPRRRSTNSQGSSLPRKQQPPAPQPLLPRTSGPGQSVFPASAPAIRAILTPETFTKHHEQVVPAPQPHLQFVNQSPFPAPSFTPPVNPALARAIHDNVPNPPPFINPLTGDLLQQPATTPMDISPQQYTTPPSRSIRGVRSGARRARGGTRKPRIKVETPDTGDPSIMASTPVSSRGSSGRGGRPRGGTRGGTRGNRGGRPRGSRAGASSTLGIKRKRGAAAADDDEKDDSDVSEIITPLPTQSRSGRKITHANTFSSAPVVIDLEESASLPSKAGGKRNSVNKPADTTTTTTQSTNNNNSGRGKNGRHPFRPNESSVCKNCTRGHSPASNMIVFCDGCNAPWHQHCHDPPISPEIIRVESTQWFCADCQVLREEKAHTESRVSASGTLSIVEKRKYLQSLGSRELVSLLLHATVLHPDLPVFATPQGGPAPERVKRPVTHFVDPTAMGEEEGEEEEEE
ncbi:MAG: hypothetical protein Q9179_005137 [Wetmoreana sp. 5 TL-2023]